MLIPAIFNTGHVLSLSLLESVVEPVAHRTRKIINMIWYQTEVFVLTPVNGILH